MVVGVEQDRRDILALHLAHQLEYLRLDRHIERGVGSRRSGDPVGRQAIAIITRWRIRQTSGGGIRGNRRSGSGIPTSASVSTARRRAGFRSGYGAVSRPRHMVAMVKTGFSQSSDPERSSRSGSANLLISLGDNREISRPETECFPRDVSGGLRSSCRIESPSRLA
jgi:hypothetical protein